jgi:hypothetical protein
LENRRKAFYGLAFFAAWHLEAHMIRNIVLLDGTWNTLRTGTNIAKLSREAEILSRLILPASDGARQEVKYFKGVGTSDDAFQRIIGGAVGIGLRTIVQDAYNWVIDNYHDDQELYIYGFSRGAYAARALAGLIGASGIPKRKDKRLLDIAWTNFQAKKDSRENAPPKGPDVQANNRIKLIGVFDTVGSYGVPAGIGLAATARYISRAVFGFKDTHFGNHIDCGLHAIGVDERRRPFTPTFWTVRKGETPPPNVEQTWFAGVHSNVGGGYPDKGLSDLALTWMIARTRGLTKLGFDLAAAREALKPSIDGAIYDSSNGWPIDTAFPRHREILAKGAVGHFAMSNANDPNEEHVNERVHWSVLAKLGRECPFYASEKPGEAPKIAPYDPVNLREAMKRLGPDLGGAIAPVTPEEMEMFPDDVKGAARLAA